MEYSPDTSQPNMDPELRKAITEMAEKGHDLESLEAAFGAENVRLAATNNSYLLELIDPTPKVRYAA